MFENLNQQPNFPFSPSAEKSFTDKTLAREEIERIREIMKEVELSRSQIHELRNLLVGINIKLVNLDDNDRAVIGHLLAHLESLFQVEEELFEYIELIKLQKNIGNDSLKLLISGRKKMEHNLKFMTDVYLYCVNSSLSLTAAAFNSYTSNKYEYSYAEPKNLPQAQSGLPGGLFK